MLLFLTHSPQKRLDNFTVKPRYILTISVHNSSSRNFRNKIPKELLRYGIQATLFLISFWISEWILILWNLCCVYGGVKFYINICSFPEFWLIYLEIHLFLLRFLKFHTQRLIYKLFLTVSDSFRANFFIQKGKFDVTTVKT